MSRLKNNRNGWKECPACLSNFRQQKDEKYCKQCKDLIPYLNKKRKRLIPIELNTNV